jgi:hypothetical protein
VPWQGLRTSNLLGGTVAWFAAQRDTSKLFLMNTSDGSMINRNPDQAPTRTTTGSTQSNVQYTNPGEDGYPIPGDGFGPQYFDGVNGQLVVLGSVHQFHHHPRQSIWRDGDHAGRRSAPICSRSRDLLRSTMT